MTETFKQRWHENKFTMLLALMCILLILTITGITIGGLAYNIGNKNTTSLQGSCQFWRDLSQLPLTPDSKPAAFAIIADSRIAYITQGCRTKLGDLPAPDPRVLPYLHKPR